MPRNCRTCASWVPYLALSLACDALPPSIEEDSGAAPFVAVPAVSRRRKRASGANSAAHQSRVERLPPRTQRRFSQERLLGSDDRTFVRLAAQV